MCVYVCMFGFMYIGVCLFSQIISLIKFMISNVKYNGNIIL